MRLHTGLSTSSVLANWLAGLVTEIDFDTVQSGTVVNNKYAGITLTAVPLNNPTPGANFGSAYASSAYNLSVADTPPNVVTINKPPQAPGFNEAGGGLLVTFAKPQLYVSIDTFPIVTAADLHGTGTNSPYMQVYGEPIPLIPPRQLPPALIATLQVAQMNANQNFESWQTLDYVSTSSTPNIGSIVLSCSNDIAYGSVYALFDRLRFGHHLPLSMTLKEG